MSWLRDSEISALSLVIAILMTAKLSVCSFGDLGNIDRERHRQKPLFVGPAFYSRASVAKKLKVVPFHQKIGYKRLR